MSCCYLSHVFDPKLSIMSLDMVESAIVKSKIEFNAIAASGVSGLLYLISLCHRFSAYPIVVRKPDDQSTHSSYGVESSCREDVKFIIIDDLINEGTTLRRIMKSIKELDGSAECLGVFLHYPDSEGMYSHSTFDGVPLFHCHDPFYEL